MIKHLTSSWAGSTKFCCECIPSLDIEMKMSLLLTVQICTSLYSPLAVPFPVERVTNEVENLSISAPPV